MTTAITASLTYRTPQAFVQFIGENNEVYNLSPDHILSVQTTKSLGNPAGTFEIMFKGGDEQTSNVAGRITSRTNAPSFDWWLERLHPMTLVIVAIGAQSDLARTEQLLTPRSTGGSTNRPAAELPKVFMERQTDADRQLLQRSIIMVGLLEDCTLSMAMTPNGPQRAIRVAGRDLGKILLDDNLNRLARAQVVSREQETRMITVGNVSNDEWQRFMDRASINSTRNAMFWRTMSLMGSDSKIPLLETITNIVNRAPSYNVQLSNSRRLQDYFDVGVVNVVDNGARADLTTSRVVMSPDLKLMSVRATMQLLTFQGPVYSALAAFAPPPMAEMYVETYGLEAKLVVRRPPFYRPGTMPSMMTAMEQFMQKAQRGQSGIDTIKTALSPFVNNTTDEFATSDPAGREGVRGLCHRVEAFRVISYTVNRSMNNAVSVYQIYPSILMRGEASELALQQGVISYLYDLAAAQRYGTTKTYRFGCPWDLMLRTVRNGAGARYVTPTTSDIEVDTNTGQARLLRPNVGSTELSLALAETMRQYYYNRDNPAMLSGQIQVVGDANYRIGDRVHLPEYNDYVFYVDAVQHNYQFGRSFLTTLSVSRGQPFVPPNRRLVPYDDALVPSVDSRGVRAERNPTPRR